ncbi:MAG: hypothetical protein HW411_1455 [Gammaproteobacteria bacterium]|nr:hypothetical protein [Gammaproteobacteria bacterium]
MHDQQTRDSQHKKNNLVMWVFLGIILYFLMTEHWAHIVPYLPWLLLAACPLMHLFMHDGHGHGGHDHGGKHKHDSGEDGNNDKGGM